MKLLQFRSSVVHCLSLHISSVNGTVTQLLDTGNLVLIQNDDKRVV